MKRPCKIKVIRASKQRSIGLFDEVRIVRVQSSDSKLPKKASNVRG